MEGRQALQYSIVSFRKIEEFFIVTALNLNDLKQSISSDSDLTKMSIDLD